MKRLCLGVWKARGLRKDGFGRYYLVLKGKKGKKFSFFCKVGPQAMIGYFCQRLAVQVFVSVFVHVYEKKRTSGKNWDSPNFATWKCLSYKSITKNMHPSINTTRLSANSGRNVRNFCKNGITTIYHFAICTVWVVFFQSRKGFE